MRTRDRVWLLEINDRTDSVYVYRNDARASARAFMAAHDDTDTWIASESGSSESWTNTLQPRVVVLVRPAIVRRIA